MQFDTSLRSQGADDTDGKPPRKHVVDVDVVTPIEINLDAATAQ